jgi:hypothetical protein
MPIRHRTAPIRRQQPLRLRCICTRNVCALGGHDVRVCERVGEREDAGEDGAGFPGEFYGGGFVALGPEEVEEECGAEDCCDEDADEDVWVGLVWKVGRGGVGGVLYDAMPT